MATWNMFSNEVLEEKRMVNAYGGPLKVADRNRCADNYKAQALRELANRLIMEEQIDNLQSRINAAIDLLDDVTPSEIAGITGFTKEKVQQLLVKVCFGG